MPKDSRTYWEKLKDPKWQRKRLELLHGEEFRCECCGSEDSTLHVHHGYYRKGADPWDYPKETLHVLCESCHDSIGHATVEIHERLAMLQPLMLFDVVKLLEDFEVTWPNHVVVRNTTHERYECDILDEARKKYRG